MGFKRPRPTLPRKRGGKSLMGFKRPRPTLPRKRGREIAYGKGFTTIMKTMATAITAAMMPYTRACPARCW